MSHPEDWSHLGQLDDAQLERRLLESAADDAPPAAASERAFRALQADARALAALTALAPAPPAEQGAQLQYPAQPRVPARAALAGLVLGVAAGASAVALWLRPTHRDAAALVPPLPPRPAAELSVPELKPESLPPVPEGVESSGAPAPRARVRAQAGTAAERAAFDRASRLAREVAALDAARAALAIGAGQRALRQIERYRVEFPDGELAADAEAVAIEALAAEGEHGALAAAARRFLARHPRDPHAARVRELAFIEPPASVP